MRTTGRPGRSLLRTAALLAGVAAAVAACGPPRIDAAEVSTLTLLRIDLRDLRAERYSLSTRGDFSFAGGLAAREGGSSWTTSIPAEEARSILEVLGDPQWWRSVESPAPPDAPDATARTTIEWVGPDWDRGGEAKGDPEALQPLLASLRAIAQRRFDSRLDDLPVAGEPFRRR